MEGGFGSQNPAHLKKVPYQDPPEDVGSLSYSF